jgi:hypothetical protein
MKGIAFVSYGPALSMMRRMRHVPKIRPTDDAYRVFDHYPKFMAEAGGESGNVKPANKVWRPVAAQF